MKRLVSFISEAANLALKVAHDSPDPALTKAANTVLRLGEDAINYLMERHEKEKEHEM